MAKGGTTADAAIREATYAEANTLLAQHVPMVPIANGGSSTAWRADVEGAHSSPLGNEEFAAIGPGADDQLVFMQSAEPIGMYCADEIDGESLRACEQVMEPLYAFEVGGTATEPQLAKECTANEDAYRLDLHAPRRRDVPRRRDLRRQGRHDVVRGPVGRSQAAACRPRGEVHLLVAPYGVGS